jgi:hypothetical protein
MPVPDIPGLTDMIVLIGNAQESEHRLNDCSAIIDSGKPRLVVRVSKMCNYDSGKTGTRCDWVFLNPNPAYWTFPPERRHWGVLAGASKIIITYPPPGTMKDGPCIPPYWRGEEYRFLHQHPFLEYLPEPVFREGMSRRFTTFAFALWALSRRFPHEQIALHGCITSQDAWRRVRWCPWHNGVGEFALYADLFRNGRIFRLDGDELCFDDR